MVIAAAQEQELTIDRISELLGADADTLLNHKSETISKDVLHLPGGDFVDRIPCRIHTGQGDGNTADTGFACILAAVVVGIVINRS